jgi:hypothetical protein
MGESTRIRYPKPDAADESGVYIALDLDVIGPSRRPCVRSLLFSCSAPSLRVLMGR